MNESSLSFMEEGLRALKTHFHAVRFGRIELHFIIRDGEIVRIEDQVLRSYLADSSKLREDEDA